MNVIVCGSRDFLDYKFMREKLNKICFYLREVVVLTNHKPGAAKLAEWWVFQSPDYCRKSLIFHPESKSEKHLRENDDEMCRNADALVAFWNGWETETEDLIKLAKFYRLKLRVIYC